MKRLVRLAFLLLIVFACAVSVVRAVGSRQPVSSMLKELRLTECTPPCWAGLTPGLSSLSEAMSSLPREQPAKRELIPQPIIGFDLAHGEFFTYFNTSLAKPTTVEFEVGNGIIQAIILPGDFGNRDSVAIPMPALGDMLNWLGTPSCMVPPRPYSPWQLIFNTDTATVSVTGKILEPARPIYRLSIQPYSPKEDPCLTVYSKPWRGLVSAVR